MLLSDSVQKLGQAVLDTMFGQHIFKPNGIHHARYIFKDVTSEKHKKSYLKTKQDLMITNILKHDEIFVVTDKNFKIKLKLKTV